MDTLKIAKAMDKFLEDYVDAERAAWTLTNYSSTLNRVVKAFPDMEIEQMTTDEIKDWLKSLEVSQSLSNKSLG